MILIFPELLENENLCPDERSSDIQSQLNISETNSKGTYTDQERRSLVHEEQLALTSRAFVPLSMRSSFVRTPKVLSPAK